MYGKQSTSSSSSSSSSSFSSLLVNVFLRLVLLIFCLHVALKNLLWERRKQKSRKNDAR